MNDKQNIGFERSDVIDRTFELARKRADATCKNLEQFVEQGLIAAETLVAIRSFLNFALGESTSDAYERFKYATLETRKGEDEISNRRAHAHGIRAGERIAIRSLRKARRAKLNEDGLPL